MKKIRKAAAPGPEGITPGSPLNRSRRGISHIPSGNHFNKSIDTGCTPEDWRTP